jgi:CDP-4-dehydro-6-deoxyglucose reductase, E1
MTLGTDVQSAREDIARQLRDLVDEYFALEPAADELSWPLAVPLFGAGEVRGALEAMLEKRVTMGARVSAFEDAFASYVGVRHALMVNSGSSANLLAVSAVSHLGAPDGLAAGDEVIVPAVTWSTTVAPLLQFGLVPVFVDVDPETLNLRVEALEQAVSARTRAIFAVHLLGNPVDMHAVGELADRHGLRVLEDTCESLGSTLGGRTVGSFGDLGTFSFFFSHHITTGEGGMVVTDDDALADVARSMRAHGWTREMSTRAEHEADNPSIDPRFLFVHAGYNLRPTELQAAFGLVQLEQLDGFNEARRRNAERLIEALGDLDLRFVREQPGGTSTWFGFPLLASDPETRAALARHLEERRIETRPILAGNLVLQPAFRDRPHRQVGDLSGATEVGGCGLFIGNHPNLDEPRLEHIVEAFRSFFRA